MPPAWKRMRREGIRRTRTAIAASAMKGQVTKLKQYILVEPGLFATSPVSTVIPKVLKLTGREQGRGKPPLSLDETKESIAERKTPSGSMTRNRKVSDSRRFSGAPLSAKIARSFSP